MSTDTSTEKTGTGSFENTCGVNAGHRANVLSDLADSEARGDLARSRTLRRILDQETGLESRMESAPTGGTA